MNVRCPSCQASFQVADDKIPARGASAHCPRCDNRFDIGATEAGAGADLFDLSPGALEEVTGEDLFAVHGERSDPVAPTPAAAVPARRRKGLFGWLVGLFGRS